MGFVKNAFERIKKQSLSTVFCWVFAKFLFGVGLGLLLAEYLVGYNWTNIGWLLILISIIISIPALKAVFGKG